MLTKKKGEDQTTCFSRAASKLHSGANKIQILLLKDSRLNLVGVTLFPLLEAKEEKKGLVSPGDLGYQTSAFCLSESSIRPSFPQQYPKSNAQRAGKPAADTP